MSSEEWRPVLGTDAYEVSSLGRVKSLQREVRFARNVRTVPERILKLSNSNGYMLCVAHRNISVHRLVAEAFVLGMASGLQVNHKDDNRSNNVPENLE